MARKKAPTSTKRDDPQYDETLDPDDILGDSFERLLPAVFGSPHGDDDYDDLFQALDNVASVGSRQWTPFPKQALAWKLAGLADETLFGGAAGPGKTEWGLEYVIAQMEQFPNNRAGVFRRVYPSLARSIIPRLKRKLPPHRAKWNGNDKTFTFPNGSVIECASLQYLDSTIDHQGTEYGLIFFEEITEFAESQWEDLIARLRPPDGCDCRPHAIATANPGGRGHVWVKRRWVKPSEEDLEVGQDRPEPTDVWRPISIPGQHTADMPPLSRTFIPATLKDNPALLEKDPTYLARLRGISDKGKRKAFESGDWDAIDQVEGALWSYAGLEGGRMSESRFMYDVSILERVVAVDPSDGDVEGDGYGVCVASRGLDSCGYIEESHDWKGVSVQTLARQTIKVYYRTGADCIVVERNHGGKWLPAVFHLIDPYVPIVEVWASEGKRTRARPVSAMMEPDDDRPSNQQYLARLVGFHPELEEELCTTIFDGKEDSPNRLDAMVWGLTHLLIHSNIAQTSQIQDERLAAR